jgi:hypothetical protein
MKTPNVHKFLFLLHTILTQRSTSNTTIITALLKAHFFVIRLHTSTFISKPNTTINTTCSHQSIQHTMDGRSHPLFVKCPTAVNCPGQPMTTGRIRSAITKGEPYGKGRTGDSAECAAPMGKESKDRRFGRAK